MGLLSARRVSATIGPQGPKGDPGSPGAKGKDGSGGGSTALLAQFTMPVIGASSPMNVGSTAEMAAGDGLTIPLFGRFIVVGAPTDATHVVALNTGANGNVSAGNFANIGAVVNIAGTGVPLAAQARTEGQALQRLGGQDTPAGMVPVINALSTGAIDDTFVTDNWPMLQNALDSHLNDTLSLQISPGGTGLFGITRPLMMTNASPGIRKVQGKNGGAAPGSTNVTGICGYKTGLAHNVPSFIGPLICVTSIVGATYNTRSGINTAVFTNSCEINLHETGQGYLDSLTAYTFECFLYVPSASVFPGNNYVIAKSYGNLSAGYTPGINSAFGLRIDTTAGNHLAWNLTTIPPGSPTTITSVTLANDVFTVTSTAHGLVTGDFTSIAGVTFAGTDAVGPNGPSQPVIRLTANTFTVPQQFSGTFTYTSGGTSTKATPVALSGIGATAFPLDTLVHVALTYDGAHVRTFIGIPGAASTLDMSVAATGPIHQAWSEDFCIGTQFGFYPHTNRIYTAANGTEYGSIRIARTAVYTSSYTTPSSELGMVPSRMTVGLWNFGPGDPAHPELGGRSETLTGTPNNPGGHPGIIVSRTNWIKIYDGYGFPDSGIPVWNHWHGGVGSGSNRNGIEFNDIFLQNAHQGIYISGCQGIQINRCAFNLITMCFSAMDFAYLCTVNNCGFSPFGADGLSYSWAIGTDSEMLSVNDCAGNGGHWVVVAMSGNCTIQMTHCYFDSGIFGAILAQTCYSVDIKNCSFFQEFQVVSNTLLYLLNVASFRLTGGAIAGMGLAAPLIKIHGPMPGSGLPGNSTFSTRFDTYFTTFGQPYPIFGFVGSVWFQPVEVNGYSPEIDTQPDPGTSVTPWLDPVGVGPLVFPNKQRGLYTFNFAAAGTLAFYRNDFWFGTWIFTDTGAHLSVTTTVTIPYNIRGARKTVHNSTSQSLSFVGPDGGTPIVIAAGKTAQILCTDTYVGSGSFLGTWIRETQDA